MNLIWDVIRLVTLGSLVGTFRDRANQWNLRRYVTNLTDNQRGYSADDRTRIKDALGISGAGFGFRLRFVAYRGYVTSSQRSGESRIPDLVAWHNDPNEATRVDLKILAGFESTSFWQRGRPEIGGSVSASDLDAYLADVAAGEIHVRHQWNPRVQAYTDPKYGPYTAALVDEAWQVIETCTRGHDAPWAFLTLRGHHYTPSTRSHHWNRVRCAAHLGDVRLYDATRHYFALYGLNVLGLTPHVSAEQLGTATAASSS